MVLDDMQLIANVNGLGNSFSFGPDGTRVVYGSTEFFPTSLNLGEIQADYSIKNLASVGYGALNGKFNWIGDHILLWFGELLDPATLTKTRNFPNTGADWTFDPTTNRFIYANGSEIRLVDGASFSDLHSIFVDKLQMHSGDVIGNMVRYGANGLAFTAAHQLNFLESDLFGALPGLRGILTNDSLPSGHPWRPVVKKAPEHGTLTLRVDGSFSYTPSNNYSGNDSFEYAITDGAQTSANTTVTILVTPANDPPAAVDDNYSLAKNRPLIIPASAGVLANDADPDGPTTLVPEVITQPAHGTLSLAADGAFVYTPAVGYFGPDAFTYGVRDASGAVSNTATARITIRDVDVNLALRAVATPTDGDAKATLPNSLQSVHVGSVYYVEVWTQDSRTNSAGITGGQVDISYTSQLANLTQLDHGQALSSFATGAIRSAQGLVDNFGGGTLTAGVGLAPGWVRMGYMRVEAQGNGVVNYALSPGQLAFGLVGKPTVSWGQVEYSETLAVAHLADVRLDLRAVLTPTTLDANGQVTTLPASFDYVNEWAEYWVEIYVNTDTPDQRSVNSARVNLTYDTRYISAQEVIPGPAFAENAFVAQIDDAQGLVANVGGPFNGQGAPGRVLLAKIRMVPTAQDQAPLDEARRYAGPYDAALQLTQPVVALAGSSTGVRTAMVSDKYPQVWAVPYDIDDNDVIDFGDLSYFAPAFGKSVSSTEPPYVWWANFNRAGNAIDFADLSLFGSNFGKSKTSGGLVFEASYPDAWVNPNLAGPPPLSAAAAVLGPPSFDPINARLVVLPARSNGDNAAAVPQGGSRVTVGQQYFLEVWLNDTSASSLGITGGEFTVAFTPGRVNATAVQHGGVYTTFARGNIDNAAGRVNNLGGGTLDSLRAARGQWTRLAVLPFQPTSNRPIVIDALPGSLQFSRYGEGNVPSSIVKFSSLVLNELPGDINRDGAVNLFDFVILRSNFGKPGSPTRGDLTGDGRVDISDFVILRSNFGRVSQAAPPPASALSAAPPPSLGGPPALASAAVFAAAVLQMETADAQSSGTSDLDSSLADAHETPRGTVFKKIR